MLIGLVLAIRCCARSGASKAGGKFRQTPVGGASVYTDTPLAKMGDMGSVVLPPVKDELQPTWTAGSVVDVAWGMRYNHGGGEGDPMYNHGGVRGTTCTTQHSFCY